jgi:hypothetical protein
MYTNWTNLPAREKALWDFCKKMADPANAAMRERCIKDHWYAKTCFAEDWFYLEGDPAAGDFKVIPSEVEFRVYDFDPEKRGDLVTIVLPPKDTPLPVPDQKVRGLEIVWRCTWPTYLTLK